MNFFFEKYYLFTLFLLFFSRPALAVVPNLDIIDSITAVTLPRASYDISITAYTKGSLQIKALLGLHDHFYLGASFDIEHLIGNEKVHANIPGVIAKFKLIDYRGDSPFLFALGYDSFYIGESGKLDTNPNPFNRVIYGPYIVFSRPVFMFEQEQHFHIGIRMPAQPDYTPNDTALYIAFDYPIGFFVPMFEINRIYFTGGRSDEILFNFGFKFNIVENFSFELNFLMGANRNTNRIIVLEYVDYF